MFVRLSLEACQLKHIFWAQGVSGFFFTIPLYDSPLLAQCGHTYCSPQCAEWAALLCLGCSKLRQIFYHLSIALMGTHNKHMMGFPQIRLKKCKYSLEHVHFFFFFFAFPD